MDTLVLAVLLAGSPGGAQPALGSKEDVRQAARHQSAIEKELRTLSSHPWAGSYSKGMGLGGSRLLLAPRSGYLVAVSSCMDTARFYGTVVEGASLELRPEQEPAGGAAFTLQPLVWGERHYLITADEARHFCDDVTTGQEPQPGGYGLFYLREGDDTRPVSGRPRTSAGELPCTLPPLITGQVVAIEKDELQLDIGHAEGVRAGMTLHVADTRREHTVLVVKRVDEHSSTAIQRREEWEQEPEVGWHVASRLLPWETP